MFIRFLNVSDSGRISEKIDNFLIHFKKSESSIHKMRVVSYKIKDKTDRNGETNEVYYRMSDSSREGSPLPDRLTFYFSPCTLLFSLLSLTIVYLSVITTYERRDVSI